MLISPILAEKAVSAFELSSYLDVLWCFLNVLFGIPERLRDCENF